MAAWSQPAEPSPARVTTNGNSLSLFGSLKPLKPRKEMTDATCWPCMATTLSSAGSSCRAQTSGGEQTKVARGTPLSLCGFFQVKSSNNINFFSASSNNTFSPNKMIKYLPSEERLFWKCKHVKVCSGWMDEDEVFRCMRPSTAAAVKRRLTGQLSGQAPGPCAPVSGCWSV